MKRLVLASIASVLVLSACSDGVDRGECLESHRKWYPPVYVKMGQMMVPIDQTRTICDLWEYPNGKPL